MAEKKKPICPNCGSEAYCFRRSKTGPLFFDFVDEYTLWCPNCGYHTASEQHAGWSFLVFCTATKTRCPFCNEPADDHAKGALFEEVSAALCTAREEISLADPEADVCPECGKGEVICAYLGDSGTPRNHSYVWNHTCTRCGYDRNFTEFKEDEDPDRSEFVDQRGPGKAGGCPGQHK